MSSSDVHVKTVLIMRRSSLSKGWKKKKESEINVMYYIL